MVEPQPANPGAEVTLTKAAVSRAVPRTGDRVTATDALALLRRVETDDTRHDLDSVIEEFGFSRAELEAELDADLTDGLD